MFKSKFSQPATDKDPRNFSPSKILGQLCGIEILVIHDVFYDFDDNGICMGY